jgi:hypothetical protein
MGDGRWEMEDGRWEMGDGRLGSASKMLAPPWGVNLLKWSLAWIIHEPSTATAEKPESAALGLF